MQQQEDFGVCPVADAAVVVLDTNVVLDWLVFEDPAFRPLAHRLTAGVWAWHATPAMRAELADVLPRLRWRGNVPDCEHILTLFDKQARIIDWPVGPPPQAALRSCRDPDDQKFLDLACHQQARWLFSRDRALLEMARAARPLGVEVLSPAQWLRAYGA
jgi:putative PIN family toxin of toxin-antitoxin system